MTDALTVLENYSALVYAKDVDGLITLYDDKAQVYDLWSEWLYDGATAWHVAVSSWLTSLGDERVIVRFDDVHSRITGELAVIHAVVTYQGQSATGEPLRAMQNRLTWMLEGRGNVWKITHEHTSAPVNGETMRVILERKPLSQAETN